MNASIAQSLRLSHYPRWREERTHGQMALVATIKTVPGKREEHLTAHAQRCLATEPRYLEV